MPIDAQKSTRLRRERQADLRNRPDEWKIEQGLHGASIPILDQSTGETCYIEPLEYEPWKDEAAIKSVGDPNELFREEREGWEGYVEWERYPDKVAKAHKILESQNVRPTVESCMIGVCHMLIVNSSSLRLQNFKWAPSQASQQTSLRCDMVRF